jgi:hypothetical protein
MHFRYDATRITHHMVEVPISPRQELLLAGPVSPIVLLLAPFFFLSPVVFYATTHFWNSAVFVIVQAPHLSSPQRGEGLGGGRVCIGASETLALLEIGDCPNPVNDSAVFVACFCGSGHAIC